MKLVIGSDKSGFTLKERIKQYLLEQGIAFEEVGTADPELGVPFYLVAPQAAKRVQTGAADMGILVCGTGMGMSQVANKYRGIRAACVESVYGAKMCRAVNDSNILCMGGWLIAPELGLEMVRTFLATGHTQDLEAWRQKFLLDAKEAFAQLENTIYGGAQA
ncbi:MAG: RpiB/LacA/LacB family sugar-phosphate isomerase [Oscillospiraceae bacterium]|nr:RpiB/LacA/LacB family sugar-phosphate isomerase [Oscillospiraceae bacterium]